MKFRIYWFVLLLGTPLIAQEIWNANPITVSKADFADWNLEENQDRITADVWLTRKNTMGIFNIAQEDTYQMNFSPMDTEWAYGTTNEIGSLVFQDWQNTVDDNPPDMVGRDMVLHLITDDIYIDFRFTAWSASGSGGGFAYTRATESGLGIDDAFRPKLRIIPNPATSGIYIFNLPDPVEVSIVDILGRTLWKGWVGPEETVDIEALPSGWYALVSQSGLGVPFVKK
ncbi:MAG: T9SS type A sorting domain-containing protein [Flavobacteriaceae bacterium]|nr:T9SS type A sorting domain-containing protein [Flavobacteriaceae bacterium]